MGIGKLKMFLVLTQVLWLQSGDEAQDEPGDGRAAEQEPAATARSPTEPQRRQNILGYRASRRRCESQDDHGWMLRDAIRKKNVCFFISLIKGGGVISIYKNLCCRFCIVQEAFLQQKWA